MSSSACFGPNNGYFFNCPKSWYKNDLPDAVMALFTRQPRIRDVSEMAIGPDGSYAVVYMNHDGSMRLAHCGLPASLEKWLIPNPSKGVARDMLTLQISLSSTGGYFAFDKNGSAWGSLPPAMNAVIEARRDSQGRFKPGQGPQSVSFGPDGAYCITTTGGGGHWNLLGQNEVLNKWLHDAPTLKGYCIVLCPYVHGRYLAFLPNGETQACLPLVQHADYEAFSAGYKSQFTRPVGSVVNAARTGPAKRRSTLGKGLLSGLKLVNGIMNAANGGGGGGVGGGNGGGDGGFVGTNTSYVPDTSSYWQPIQSAASSPIQ